MQVTHHSGGSSATLATYSQPLLVCAAALLVATQLMWNWRPPVAEAIAAGSGAGLARLSDQVSIRAEGRGAPYINLGDGRDVLADYRGPAELTEALQRNEARPLALASADLDRDGVPDLVSGYSHRGRGIVTIHRGNVDSIYPNSPEAQRRRAEGTYTDSPFLSPALVFETPEAAHFVGCGDFDGDSHQDVVTAKKDGNTLQLLSGDSRGNLRHTRAVALPGVVTALSRGEINRADGLEDIVVGVNALEGPRVLVFEAPGGALTKAPEQFSAPVEVRSLVLGQLDEEYTYDLAIAAGNNLMIVSGRDRTPSPDWNRQAELRPARIDRREMPFQINSIAVGDFSGSGGTDIALLAEDGAIHVLRDGGRKEGAKQSTQLADRGSEILHQGSRSPSANLVRVRTSSLPLDNLAVVDPQANELQLILARVETREAHTGRVTVSAGWALSTEFGVAGGPIATLPMRLNSDALSDLVVIKAGSSAPTVVRTQAARTFTVTNTSDDGPGSLRQAILDANNNSGLDQISFNIAPGGSTISPRLNLPKITEPVVIDGTTASGPGVELDGSAAGQNTAGLWLQGSGSTIRGLIINRFTNTGIFIDSRDNIVEGNYIGTDRSGMTASGNANGVIIYDGSGNVIGGSSVAARNIISGNLADGVGIYRDGTADNKVQGNYIGTDQGGNRILGNTWGVYISDAANNVVGGVTGQTRNIISGNIITGVQVNESGATGNRVQGNYIGTDQGGNRALGNRWGIGIVNAPSTLIGGLTAVARNIISGNTQVGIGIYKDGAADNKVQGNYIGTDATGTQRLGNNYGVIVLRTAPGNIIGGPEEGARNIISANAAYGVGIGIESNDPDDKPLPPGQINAVVEGNYIGTDHTGAEDLGNNGNGIKVGVNSVSNSILGNRIAYSGLAGISLLNSGVAPGDPAVRIRIEGNVMFANGKLTPDKLNIDLGDDGPTANDLLDGDAGANLLQNYPVLTAASFGAAPASPDVAILQAAAPLSVTVRFNSEPNKEYRLEFFYGGCSGSGSQFIGSIPVRIGTETARTDANGDYSRTITFDFRPPAAGGFVNATATSVDGNTSEFSQCIQVTGTPPAPAPVISRVYKEGKKKLVVEGANFQNGAKIYINQVSQKTTYGSAARLVGKKAGKGIKPGDKVMVMNSDDTPSAELVYSP